MSCWGEPGGSEFHLGEGNGGIFTFPVYPDYSLWVTWWDREGRRLGIVGSEHCAGADGADLELNCT